MDPAIINWDIPEGSESDHICENEGCSHRGFACRLPGDYNDETKEFGEDEIEYLCAEHAQEQGYCMGCGEFIAGTGMEFTNNGYCDNCWDEITSSERDDAVTKAVLLMGPEPSATQLIKNLKIELSAIFNKAGIEVTFEKEQIKYSLGPTKTTEQRIADLEAMVYNLNKLNGIK